MATILISSATALYNAWSIIYNFDTEYRIQTSITYLFVLFIKTTAILSLKTTWRCSFS